MDLVAEPDVRLLTLSAALAALLFLAAGALAEDFGGFRGPDHNGIYPARDLVKAWPEGGPRLLWKVEGLGEAWGPPVVVGETVYVLGGCHPGRLHAFTLDGGRKWSRAYGTDFSSRFDGSRSTITVSDGLVVFNSGKKDERSTYALDAETGQTVWHVDGTKRFGSHGQGWGWNASPLVYGDKVIADMRSKDDVCPPVVAVEKRTGETAWKTDPSPGDLSAGDQGPQLAFREGDCIVVYNAYRTLLGIDPNTGKRLWAIETTKAGGMAPLYNEGYLYTSHSGATHMYRLKDLRSEPKLLWSTRPKEVHELGQAVILGGRVYVFGEASTGTPEVAEKGRRTRGKRGVHWLCLDAETGRQLQAEPCMDAGSIIAADGMLYFLEGGERHKATPKISLVRPTAKGFEKVSSFDLPPTNCEVWANPSIHAGRLFYRCGDMVAVYDLRAEGYD